MVWSRLEAAEHSEERVGDFPTQSGEPAESKKDFSRPRVQPKRKGVPLGLDSRNYFNCRERRVV